MSLVTLLDIIASGEPYGVCVCGIMIHPGCERAGLLPPSYVPRSNGTGGAEYFVDRGREDTCLAFPFQSGSVVNSNEYAIHVK